MKNKEKLFHDLTALAIDAGATRAKVIEADTIKSDKAFRDMCAANSCGMYGKCHMCPPDIGEIDVMMNELKTYKHALVYQLVSPLEDSFDFEGMMTAKKHMYRLSQKIRTEFDGINTKTVLHLGAGGCGACASCAKQEDKPCRNPSLAMSSLEAYGIDVSQLAAVADMKYINGANTVTYFGAVLFSCEGDGE